MGVFGIVGAGAEQVVILPTRDGAVKKVRPGKDLQQGCSAGVQAAGRNDVAGEEDVGARIADCDQSVVEIERLRVIAAALGIGGHSYPARGRALDGPEL